MKALGMATALVFFLIGGILVWAMANGSPLAGEPTAFLEIKNDKKNVQTTRVTQASTPYQMDVIGGHAQVMLDVTPFGKATSRENKSGGAGRFDGLVEQSKFGALPKRAADGRSPAQAYARPKQAIAGTMPRIAVLVTGLGLNRRLSQRAVAKLPAEISLAFSSYGQRLPELTKEARRQGHELMLQVPLEPLNYPQSDTGPKTLLAKQTLAENLPRLKWSLGRFTGYFGVVNAKGGRYLATKRAADGLFKELQRRGLLFFRDNASGGSALSRLAEQIGLGYSQATLQIDRKPSASGVRKALEKLELNARRSGMAVGVAHMHPVSIDMLSQWAKSLEKRGLRLVPVSALYRKPRRL